MKILVFLMMILMASGRIYGSSSDIITCEISHDRMKAQLRLDAVGSGSISIFNTARKPVSKCALKLLFFSDSRQAIVPHVKASFEYLECVPNVESLSKRLLPDLILIIDIHNDRKTRGRVQWLNDRQPDACDVKTLKLKEIALKSKQWREGKWGRKKHRHPTSTRPSSRQ